VVMNFLLNLSNYVVGLDVCCLYNIKSTLISL
jgi:hypothetical protein